MLVFAPYAPETDGCTVTHRAEISHLGRKTPTRKLFINTNHYHYGSFKSSENGNARKV